MKVYRISVKNASRNDRRELLYGIYRSKKEAESICKRINEIEPERMAFVMVQVK